MTHWYYILRCDECGTQTEYTVNRPHTEPEFTDRMKDLKPRWEYCWTCGKSTIQAPVEYGTNELP
jgi:hypothetical protein